MSNKMTKEMEYFYAVVIGCRDYKNLKHSQIDEKYSDKVENNLQKMLLPSLRENIFSKIFSDYPSFQELGLDHSVIVSLVNKHLNDPANVELI